MTALDVTPSALDAYERLAAHYDLITAGYAHDRWIVALDRLARRHGLAGSRALDLGCGTGRALTPLRDLGYDLTGCDVSPAMVSVARDRHPDVEIHVADMRALPPLEPFDLVLCLDDTVNYLLDEHELVEAFASVRSVLGDSGLMVFDVNTELAYDTAFRRDHVVSDGWRVLAWRGQGLDERSGLARATIEIFTEHEQPGLWVRDRSEHVQRRWLDTELTAAAHATGLRVVDRVGQRTGAVLEAEPDPSRHSKVVYVLRHDG
jgi:SAM-dependent methyltransferase